MAIFNSYVSHYQRVPCAVASSSTETLCRWASCSTKESSAARQPLRKREICFTLKSNDNMCNDNMCDDHFSSIFYWLPNAFADLCQLFWRGCAVYTMYSMYHMQLETAVPCRPSFEVCSKPKGCKTSKCSSKG